MKTDEEIISDFKIALCKINLDDEDYLTQIINLFEFELKKALSLQSEMKEENSQTYVKGYKDGVSQERQRILAEIQILSENITEDCGCTLTLEGSGHLCWIHEEIDKLFRDFQNSLRLRRGRRNEP